MLTVLHTESSSGWGGQENRTLHECLGLKRLGSRPIILCRPGSKLREKAEAAGIEVKTHGLRASYDISAVARIMELVKREKVDVISTHSGTDSFLGAVAGRLSSRRPRIVRTRHLALPITSKTTYSVFPHRVVTVSAFVRDYLVKEKGIPAEKVVSIPTGVDLTRFDPANTPDTLRAELGLEDGVPIAGTIAILRRKKGHHVLMEAIPGVLKEVPDAVFVFAGDGPQRENIVKRLGELGVMKNVRLLGLRSDVPSILRGIDVFVLPTLQEALGTSMLEASAMRKPVIAGRVGGVPEVVQTGVTGILVEPDDPKGLEHALIKLLKDKRLCQEMGLKGRLMVERDFSTTRMVEKMHALYAGLVKDAS